MPPQETFTEELLLTPLPDGKVSALFEFRTTSFATKHYHLLPKVLQGDLKP